MYIILIICCQKWKNQCHVPTLIVNIIPTRAQYDHNLITKKNKNICYRYTYTTINKNKWVA